MSPAIPPHPFGPGGGMFAADPRNTHLFTQRPNNGVSNPSYSRPGVREITADQAYALVAWLNAIGFNFSKPRVKGGSSEGVFVFAEKGGPSDVHYSVHNDPTPDHPDDSGANDLTQVADLLGGSLSSPVHALSQLAYEVGIAPITFRAVTNEAIVAALKGIFG